MKEKKGVQTEAGTEKNIFFPKTDKAGWRNCLVLRDLKILASCAICNQ